MKRITPVQIVLIHAALIRKTGGRDGIRDLGLLKSAAAIPFQTSFRQDLYPSPFEKAAAYARSIIMNHAFVDGNKRSGMAVAISFLELNGFVFSAPKGSVEDFAVKIVVDKLDIEDIAKWFKLYSKTCPGSHRR